MDSAVGQAIIPNPKLKPYGICRCPTRFERPKIFDHGD